MGYFPFFTDVEKLHGVIIGGGNVALEKVERLVSSNARITLVASAICDEIKKYSGEIELIEKDYESEVLLNADYVIAATDNMELNRQIYSDAKKRNLLVNVVDVPELCDFIFPSVLQKGKLVVGVSTSGAGPRIAIRLKNEIEKIIPEDIEEKLDYLAEERIKAKENIKDAAKRRAYLIELANTVFENGKR